MPGSQHGPSILNARVYDALRRQGMSKQRAARISNAQLHKLHKSHKQSAIAPLAVPPTGPNALFNQPGVSRSRRRDARLKQRALCPQCRLKADVPTVEVPTGGSRQIAPGVTRIRGNLCNVHGKYGRCPGAGASAPRKGKKPKQPAKTPEQRQAERDALHAKNTQEALGKLNIAPDGQQALEALRKGEQPDADAVARGGFEQAGLVERADDGSFRMTASGRALLSAAAAGDAGRAGDTISSARDRVANRKPAKPPKEAKPAKGGGGGGGKGKPDKDQQRADNRKKARDGMAEQDVGIAPAGFDALTALGDGQEPDDTGATGLISMGLAERGSDGHLRLTSGGRVALRAADSGDVKRTADAISAAHDRASAATDRATARQQRAEQTRRRRAENEARRQQRKRTKAERFGGKKRSDLNESDFAGPDRTFPIMTAQDVKDAARLVGHAANPAAVKRKIIAIAKRKGFPLPDAWEKTTKALRVVEHGGNTTLGNATLPEAYAHAMKYGEVSQQWLDKMLQERYAYQVPGNGYALYEQGELAAKRPELQTKLDEVRTNSRSGLKEFSVCKQKNGTYRWVAMSSNAYQDRDQEIVSEKALLDDCARADQDGDYGPLRWWHQPNITIGECDFNHMHGRMLVESGTFKDAAIGQAVAKQADRLQLSIGFTHTADEPDASGVFHHIKRFERSLVPMGRAANPFTSIVVKEPDMASLKEAWGTFVNLFDGDEEKAKAYATAAEQTQKELDEKKARYKDAPEWAQALIGRIDVLEESLKAFPPAAPPEGSPEEEAAESPEEAMAEGDTADDGSSDNMLNDSEIQAIAQAVVQAITPLLDLEKKMAGHMADLKTAFGQVSAAKDDRLAKLEENVKTLVKGDLPQSVVDSVLAGAGATYRPSQAAGNILPPEAVARVKSETNGIPAGLSGAEADAYKLIFGE
jgi:hypothetical protein